MGDTSETAQAEVVAAGIVNECVPDALIARVTVDFTRLRDLVALGYLHGKSDGLKAVEQARGAIQVPLRDTL